MQSSVRQRARGITFWEMLRDNVAVACLAFLPSSVGAQEVVRYVHTDALGSPVAESDESGNVVVRYEYEPYGASIGDSITEGPGFTGHVLDSATDLIYMQQRYYDPQIGRFLSVDPVTAYARPVETFNRYRYGNGNPYRFTDPDGRQSCESGSMKCHPSISSSVATMERVPRASPDGARQLQSGVTSSSSRWNDIKGRLGLSGELTRNGNILDAGALAHDIFYPLLDSPGGGGVKLGAIGFFALRLGPVVGSLKGLGNIGSHGVVDASVALNSGIKWMGKGYAEIGPGVYRSADGLRQFRMTTSDLAGSHGTIGSHVHFEALNKAGNVVENLHLGVTP